MGALGHGPVSRLNMWSINSPGGREDYEIEIGLTALWQF
jgi:hypothetical protein